MQLSASNDLAQKSLAIIMGGGAGTRLYPLTKERAKPAVPLGGKYRLVDIPISNCLNSSMRQMLRPDAVQHHEPASAHHGELQVRQPLDHPVVRGNPRRPADPGKHRVGIRAPPTPCGRICAISWSIPAQYFVILSGDQLYHMDYRDLLRQHADSGADITLGTVPVASEARRANSGSCTAIPTGGFSGSRKSRKTRRCSTILKIPPNPLLADNWVASPDEELFQASMGIYVFNRQVLIDALDNDFADFGKHIIPAAIEQAPRPCLYFPGVLGRHRHDPGVFRGEPRPDGHHPALQFF